MGGREGGYGAGDIGGGGEETTKRLGYEGLEGAYVGAGGGGKDDGGGGEEDGGPGV